MPGRKDKKIQFRLRKRLQEKEIYKPTQIWFIPTTGTLIMLLVTVLIATLVLNWSSKITPPLIGSSAAVSVVRLDGNTAAVTIISIEPKNAVIKYLLFNNSMGSRLLNISHNTSITLRNAGETSFIQASPGDMEITAVFNDSTQKVVYQGRI